MNGIAKGSELTTVAVDSVRDKTGRTDEEENGEKEREDEGNRKKESRKERSKKSGEKDVPYDGVSYDRGWAWMIVLAGFVNFVIGAGYNRATYIFFVHFLGEFQAPVTETALLFGVKAGINSVAGLFIMNAVVGRFGARRTVFVGGACLSLSAILGSFARDVTSLILSQAVFHGLAMSMLNMPATVLLGFYFKRRRSLANSITKCGVGVGAVTFPPIVTFLLDQYGLRGALLLMGAICMHTLLAAMLLRPTSFYKKRKELLKEEGSGERLSENAADDGTEGENSTRMAATGCECDRDRAKADRTGDANDNLHKTGTGSHDDEDDTEGAGDGCDVVIELDAKLISWSAGQSGGQTVLPPLSYRLADVAGRSRSTPALHNSATNGCRRRTISFSDDKLVHLSKDASTAGRSGHLLDSLSQSSVVRYMSAPHLELDTPCGLRPADHIVHTAPSHQPPDRTCLRRAGEMARKVVGVLDFGLFHSPMFRLLVVFFIASPMVNAVTTYLPAMATERGLEEQQAALLLSIIGGLDFCCRLVCGFVADLKVIKVSTMIVIAFTILGVVCQLTRLMTSFPLLVGLAVAQGLLGGVAACLMPVLIMEDIGLENTAKALGFNKLFSGAAMAAFHPLLGYIRDSTGSYDVAYHVIGAFTLLSAVVMFCLRFLPHTLPPSRDKHVPGSQELCPLNQNTDATGPRKPS